MTLLAARTEKHADGLWHVVHADALITVCGRVLEPQRQGRPGRATCATCTAPPAPVILPDPPLRADGCCVVCGKPRKPERSRKYGGVAAEIDPFCSSDCCRRWHGTPIRGESIWALTPGEGAAA